MAYSEEFPGWRDQIRRARTWTDNILAAHSEFEIPDDAVASTVLLVSEAATNAVCHTASGRGGMFTVRMTVDRGRIRVDVEDEGKAESIPFLRPATPMAERGRGIRLIDMLADTWAPLPRPRCGIAFTITWAAERTAPADLPGHR
ncbi:ATP-binding protein [Nocardiopsis mangrovi]|uniref:ATP-binding protein n=1 Tax=Nocardiopsis mangrovi TaxID=1179818 RepID=A0ABV9DU36_9ACTN